MQTRREKVGAMQAMDRFTLLFFRLNFLAMPFFAAFALKLFFEGNHTTPYLVIAPAVVQCVLALRIPFMKEKPRDMEAAPRLLSFTLRCERL
jgi:hypothetical protein